MADGSPPPDEAGKKPLAISAVALDEIIRAFGNLRGPELAPHPVVPMRGAREIFAAAKPVVPAACKDMALDSALKLAEDWDSTGLGFASAGNELLSQGIGFLGYPFLAELTQRPEYRKISETIAEELTRKWIRITAKGDKDKTARVEELEEAVKTFKLRDRFKSMGELDGFMGRAQLFADVGDAAEKDDSEELKKPLMLTREKIGKGTLKAFRTIEPMWSYPLRYNAVSPLKPDFYVPQSWAVMQHEVHSSRLLTFIGRPMPDILKPAYAFGGLSLSQMAMPYVQNWLRTRQSVSDLVHSFSVMILATTLGQELTAGGMAELVKRAQMAIAFRDNRGLQMIDKESEDFKNVSAPIAGLEKLQAQSQEQMSSVSSIPLIKLLGITPSGLNATAEPEIRVFYDKVKATQEWFFGEGLKRAMHIIELHLWGEIDPDIVWEFIPLWELDEAAKASVWKTNIDSDVEAVNAGILDPSEPRKRIAAAADSPYAGIDVDDIPEPPGGEEGDEPDLPNPAKTAEPAKVERAGDEAPCMCGDVCKCGPNCGCGPSCPCRKPGGANYGKDAAFREADHPRDPEGKFTDGSGGGVGTAGGGAWKAGERPPFTAEETKHLPARVAQPVATWEALQAKAETGRAQLSERLTRVAASLGLKTDIAAPEMLNEEHVAAPHGYLFIGPNKSEARAKAKVEADYGGDYSQLKDMIRASIAVNDVGELRRAIEAVEGQGLKLAMKPKDKFSNPTPEGYRDLNTVVRLPNGMLAEVQYHLKSMIRAKGEAHPHYEAQQALGRQYGEAEPSAKWKREHAEEFSRRRELQRALYDPLWERASA